MQNLATGKTSSNNYSRNYATILLQNKDIDALLRKNHKTFWISISIGHFLGNNMNMNIQILLISYYRITSTRYYESIFSHLFHDFIFHRNNWKRFNHAAFSWVISMMTFLHQALHELLLTTRQIYSSWYALLHTQRVDHISW